jgi:hypothetical protein
MSTWQAFYSGLAASDPGVKAAFEKVAVDWSELAEWVRRRHVFDDATDLYRARP